MNVKIRKGRGGVVNAKQSVDHMHFAEDVGLMFEQVGLPRMAGRIFGRLLISDPPHQSHGDLADGLQASKGSISTMTRLLIQLSLIERISLPGDRRDYFQIRPNAWAQMTNQRLSQIVAFRRLADRGLDLLKQSPPHTQQRLKEMQDFHLFWEQELPQLAQKWEARTQRS
jgi:DNA-binding transcriptional regulator GbsR (MarR family)